MNKLYSVLFPGRHPCGKICQNQKVSVGDGSGGSLFSPSDSCLLAVPATIGYVRAAYTDNAVHVPGRGNAGRYDFLKKYFEKAGRCDILTMLS